MKYISQLIISVIFLSISFSAYAKNNDLMILGSLKGHESKNTQISLEKGNATIEVFSPSNGVNITCQFMDATGKTAPEQKHVTHCLGNVKLADASNLTVKVTNNQTREIDYRIHIHETK